MPGDELVLDFSLAPARLRLDNERIRVRHEDDTETFVPLADTAVVVLSHRRVTCSGAVLAGVMRHGGAVVVCDGSNMPVGLMLPLGANRQQTRKVRAQINASRPTVKRLWQGIVRAKIRSQAHTLEVHTGDDAGLRALAERVRSGDPENVESTAAQRYWPRIFRDPMFRRRFEAPDQNRLLNYGYAILRAAVGRAVCAAGLHPSVALHHHGRENSWALADDLVEPYRPVVDDEAAEIVASFGPDIALDSPIKARLIAVLHARVWGSGSGPGGEGESRTVADWITRTAQSLARIYTDGTPADRVFYPEGLWREGPRR